MGRYDSPYAGDTLAYSHAGNSLAKTTSFRSRSRSRSQSRGRSRSRGRSQSQGIEVSLRQSDSASRGRSRRRSCSRSQRSADEKINSKQTTRSTLAIRSGSAKQRDRRRSRSRIRSGVRVTDESGIDSNRGRSNHERDGSNDDSDDRSHDLSMITPHPFLPPKGPVTCLSLVDDIKNITSWNARFVWIQLLSGLSVALVQVPECVSYAYIAGIDPFHALQSTWVANVLVPLVGGRPGMLSGTSGLGAIAIRYLVVNYGMEYIFYAVMLSGLCQVLFGALRIGRYLRLLPPGITIGMVNALCILLVLLQFRYFKEFPAVATPAAEETSAMDEPTRRLDATTNVATEVDQPWAHYFGHDMPWSSSTSKTVIISLEALATIAICFLLPKFSRVVPSPLVALLVLTGVNVAIGAIWPEWDAATIGDYTATESTSSMVWMGIFHSSYNIPNLVEWQTIAAIVPTGLSLFCISLLETMVALNVTDKYTNTDSEQDRVLYGQGVANLACGIMAGMGSAGVPQSSLHNLRNGGVSSTSAFMAGVYMLLIVMFAYPAVAHVPLGATMGVTLYLVWCMMQWRPLAALVLKAIPDQCLLSRPKLLEMRLAVPDLVSTMVTSILVLFSSTFALAGFFVGAMCYACDPIGHAIISTDNPKGYTFIDLKLSKPQATMRNPLRRNEGGDSTASQSSQSVEDEFSSEYSPA
ncbi:hypothetical protein ACHAXT_012507 [Thalassiosira profunda]